MNWTRLRRLTALTAAAAAVATAGTGVAYASGGWTVQTLPASKTNVLLYGSSCASATACVAVGVANNQAPPAYSWDGTNWTLTHLPTPPLGPGQLNAVSCYNAQRCMATGSQTSNGAPVPLTEQRYGSSWRLETAPMPSGQTEAELTSVSCPAANWCMATGPETAPGTSGFVTAGLAEDWNGSDWTIVPMPLVGSSTYVNRVSCTSASFCVAVGSSDNSANDESAVIETWNGTSWSSQQAPPPLRGAADGSGLNGVSCSAANACTAVGFYVTAEGADNAAIIRWNGTAWAKQAFQLERTVWDVSCTSAASCMALGSAQARSAGLPQLFHWNGTGWKTVTTPSEGNGSLYGLGCSRRGYCTAEGTYPNPARHPIDLPLVIAN
jgi:hypothetical protein